LCLKIITVLENNEELQKAITLFVAYQQELNEDLCFQSFEEELQNPLKKYGAPTGILLLAYYNNELAGCIALQQLCEVGVCEMKRLYIKPIFRKNKIGEQLVQQLLIEAKKIGYVTMKLDTLQKLQPAIRLYEKIGFVHTTSYYNNPLNNVVYMEKNI
jgi:putative acetyltransferase